MCTATHEADCEASSGCLEDGDCVLLGAVCVPSQASCEASTGCAEEGRCSHHEAYDVCAALTDADCEGSEICLSQAMCSALVDCGDDASCQIWGQCVEVAE